MPPAPNSASGKMALAALVRGEGMMGALSAVHAEMGDCFRLPLPGFAPVVLVGPEANRLVLVQEKPNLLWRSEGDPVTRLLNHGLLVEDGERHDNLRRVLNPALHRSLLAGHAELMAQTVDETMAHWQADSTLDMLVEMRKLALLILARTLYAEDIGSAMPGLWRSLLRTIEYISPGMWLLIPGAPRPGYRAAIARMNGYLYALIANRRARGASSQSDLIGVMIEAGFSDDLIRDQLLTMLIAGHDTVTALLAWAIHLLARHPATQGQIACEIAALPNQHPETLANPASVPLLEQTIKETLRLYPPIHLGSRVAARPLAFQQYTIPAGTRVLYSIYLSHRHKALWESPEEFMPERFGGEEGRLRAPYLYLPFGGGARNCIGMAFAQVEARIVLTKILARFALHPEGNKVSLHMGATLEPHPGVWTRLQLRTP